MFLKQEFWCRIGIKLVLISLYILSLYTYNSMHHLHYEFIVYLITCHRYLSSDRILFYTLWWKDDKLNVLTMIWLLGWILQEGKKIPQSLLCLFFHRDGLCCYPLWKKAGTFASMCGGWMMMPCGKRLVVWRAGKKHWRAFDPQKVAVARCAEVISKR